MLILLYKKGRVFFAAACYFIPKHHQNILSLYAVDRVFHVSEKSYGNISDEVKGTSSSESRYIEETLGTIKKMTP
ncbi:hypothetical protein DP091_23665 [Paenibacillus sp. MDMC362]|nr:hypothetical protein DP091_23665 [Paenibacillus sp. MDMC362]